MPENFLIMRTADAKDLPLPARMSREAAGLDLYANVHEDQIIQKGVRVLIPAGIRIALPQGYEAQIRPRSGLALQYGISIPNAPATVDADYRGELKILLINHGEDDFIVRRGDRIAQMVIARVAMVDFVETEVLPPSERGENGFGHTGRS